MAITVRQNNQNRVVYAFDKNGYMYTVGPKNGIGKLYQPGTRGLVVDDTAGSDNRPYFVLRSSNRRVTDTRYGYFAKWTTNQSTVQYQTGGYSDNWGLDDLILQNPNYLNSSWLFPCTISAFSYAIDDSRYGDKPITGTYSLFNQNTWRFLQLPNTNIYKWEVHVVLTAGSFTSPTMLRAFDVYLPYIQHYSTPQASYGYVKLNRIMDTSVDGSFTKIAYFSREMSVNLYNGAVMNFPVLYYDGNTSDNIRYDVQTKFCFKND